MRCRPMNKKESAEKARRCVDISEKTGEVRINKKSYTFDKGDSPFFFLDFNLFFQFLVRTRPKSASTKKWSFQSSKKFLAAILARFSRMVKLELAKHTRWKAKKVREASFRGKMIRIRELFRER